MVRLWFGYGSASVANETLLVVQDVQDERCDEGMNMPFPIPLPESETLDEQLDTFPRLVDSGVSLRAPNVTFPYYIAPHLLAQRVLGEGGTAVVFEALHTRLKVRVAVKVLKISGPGASEARERMQREAELCARIDNPRIPRIFDVDTLRDGTPYVVMESVHGRPLDQVLADGPLEVDLACTITCEVLEAIGELHSAGIVHRDVKPSNLILEDNATQTLRVRVLDLGIAKPLTSDPHGVCSPALTLSGTLVGTPHYMAMEQLLAGEVDGRTDLYAVGVMLYECLAGRPPFEGETVSEVIAAAMRHQVTPLDQLRHDVPERLQQIIQCAMQQDAALRYPSTGAMFDELRAFQASQRAPSQVAPALVPLVIEVAPFREQRVQRAENALWATRALDSLPPPPPARGRRPFRPRAWLAGVVTLVAAALTIAWPAPVAEPRIPKAAVPRKSASDTSPPVPAHSLTERPRVTGLRLVEPAAANDRFDSAQVAPSSVGSVPPAVSKRKAPHRSSTRRRAPRIMRPAVVPPTRLTVTPRHEDKNLMLVPDLEESPVFAPAAEVSPNPLPGNPYVDE